MNKLNELDRFAARLLMVSFFLPAKWQEVSVMVVSAYFVYRSLSIRQPMQRQDFGWALITGSLFFLYLFAVPVTPPDSRAFLWILCQRKVSLILMPIAFVIIGPFFRRAVLAERSYFVYACFLSCMAGNADYLYHYFFFHGGLHHLSHVDYRVIFERFTGIHPTYMGMFLCFSISIVLTYSGFNYPAGRKIKYALFYFLLVFLLALLVKSALLALMIIFVHYAYKNRNALYQYKLQLTGMIAAVVAACFFIPFIGQRVKEVLTYFGMGKPGNTADNSVYLRKLLLDTDTHLVKANWLTGVGPARVIQVLKERYFFYSLANNFNVGYYDPHNEYFSEWLSFGITGILVLILLLAIHFRKAIIARDHLYLYTMIVFFTTFFTETLLSRQDGVLFYAIFTSLFFFSAKPLGKINGNGLSGNG